MSGATGGWHDAWVAALDDLELDVAATEALLAETHRVDGHPLASPWRPPAGLGPLPLELRPRADRILARQTAAAAELARRMVVNRQQAAVVARIETGGSHAGPAYVDCAM